MTVSKHLCVTVWGATTPDWCALRSACLWFETVSGGAARIQLRAVAAIAPHPARQLALNGTYEEARAALHRALGERGMEGPMLILGPKGARPHAWHLASGLRYAVVPADAASVMIAHELGHLLFGWPDVVLPVGSGVRCLMARVPPVQAEPDPPCAPLRVAAGWQYPLPLHGDECIVAGRVYAWLEWLVERQADRLAAFRLSGPAYRPNVQLHAEFDPASAAPSPLALLSRSLIRHHCS